jgi:hypothetical protein
MQNTSQKKRGHRSKLRGLHDNAVSSGYGRCKLFDGDEKWMVPWGDLGDDTQRNAANIVQVVSQKWGACAFLRTDKRSEVLEPLGETPKLSSHFLDGPAGLQRLESSN